ncbi:GNAT family N-acetyltransferase [Pseudonocardia sp. TRM90224]|uniref:GNAT family N-acetyltransferase n=1 Tax=Pseudonocardia sp. TRM90224 TaxID=2812678 RepID=UPI001E511E4E|nr:GNAT family N-acetyltransferase [Pseudonocardia sp. TRM90224]
MHTVAREQIPDLRPWFLPERPGPMMFEHAVRSGVGRCLVDRPDDPRSVVVALPGGNYQLRGAPTQLTGPDGLDSPMAGFVEAPPQWLPALQEVHPNAKGWGRIIYVLPDDVDLPAPRPEVRRLVASDAAGLAALDEDISWIHETWDGAEGLAKSELGWAAFVDDRPVSIAVPFYVGAGFEDIGVVTDAGHRGTGLSTACTAAAAADIRSRGKQPCWSTSYTNLASQAVATKVGFVKEREDVLYAVGIPIPG